MGNSGGFGEGDGNGLGAFLRARRAAVDPAVLGFPYDGRPRRVPGLRREELAQAAHVSIDYVVRLEQGRSRRVTGPVLDALADALHLAPDERVHLFTLADVIQPARSRRPGRAETDPKLRQLLDEMRDIPAMILNRRMDVLAWNSMAAALLADFSKKPAGERNLIRMTFLDEAFRSLYTDWPRAARDCVAALRMAAGHDPADPAVSALVGELSVRDPDFRVWWAGHQVRGPRELTKSYRHRLVGDLLLDVHQFSVDALPDQRLIAYTAPPGSPSEERLRFLVQWAASDDEPMARPENH